MRKTILASDGLPLAAPSSGGQLWLDLATLATVDVSSEDEKYPVEQAFTSATALHSPGGWRAALPGRQTLQLRFDSPQTIQRVMLHFLETEHERSQEFSLHATTGANSSREIVRQQWSFSPNGSTEEQENYQVHLDNVVTLTLHVDPDRGQNRYPATLLAFRVEASSLAP